MAWNEPGGNRNDNDPWGGGNRGDQGPPDLDEALKKGMDKLNKLLGGSGSGRSSGSSSGSSAPLFIIIAIALIGFLAYQSFYTVNERERAVVLRFGKFLETKGPGLQFQVPLIDQYQKVDVTSVRSSISRGHMLTEDENIVEVNLSVQYVVKDPRKFVLHIRNAERTLDYATDSALRHEVGSSELHQVITEGRSVLAIRIEERLQRFLDFYETGLEVKKVNIEDAAAPREVRAAFDDVQRAKEDEQRVKEEAEAYKNKVVPESRGRAQRMLEEASAYKEEVISRATGDTARFLKILAVYHKAPEVTRERLYIESMQSVMSRSSKVLVDVDGGNNVMYLPLDKLASGSSSVQSRSIPREATNGMSESDIERAVERAVNEQLNALQTSSRRGR